MVVVIVATNLMSSLRDHETGKLGEFDETPFFCYFRFQSCLQTCLLLKLEKGLRYFIYSFLVFCCFLASFFLDPV